MAEPAPNAPLTPEQTADNAAFVTKYVDLSQVTDPRTKSEMERTLEYFASKPEGRQLLEQAGQIGGKDGKVSFTDWLGDNDTNAFTPAKHTININVIEISQTQLYTAAPGDQVTYANKLGQTMWHELEHARDPRNRDQTVDYIADEIRPHVAESLDLSDKALINYMLNNDGNLTFRSSDPADAGKPIEKVANDKLQVVTVDGMPVKEFRQKMITSVAEECATSMKGDNYTTAPELQNFRNALEGSDNFAAVVEHVVDVRLEEPTIARTNAAMHLYYPDDPERATHAALFDNQDLHEVDSGTLTATQQMQADMKFGYQDMMVTMQAQAEQAQAAAKNGTSSTIDTLSPDAPVKATAAAQPEAKSQPDISAALAFAGIDLSGISFKGVSGGVDVDAQQAHTGKANVTQQVPQQQSGAATR